jgi:hypothetical protein
MRPGVLRGHLDALILAVLILAVLILAVLAATPGCGGRVLPRWR